MLCFVKLLLADRDVATYVNGFDCVLARATNRRLKKGYYASVGPDEVWICDRESGSVVCRSAIPGRWGARRNNTMTKNLILKIEIPEQYLKRIHKPRVKKVVQPKFDAEMLAEVNRAADALDKILPLWIKIDLTGDVQMSIARSCVLGRVGKVYGIECPYTVIENLLSKHCGFSQGQACFLYNNYVEIWRHVLAERQTK